MEEKQKSFSVKRVVGTLFGVVAIIIIFSFLFGGGLEEQAAQSVQDIEDQVAADSVREYELSLLGGDPIEICVQAGFVVAAYLQAEDQANYLKWKEIEKEDCSKTYGY